MNELKGINIDWIIRLIFKGIGEIIKNCWLIKKKFGIE
jgi:hypothetical protein